MAERAPPVVLIVEDQAAVARALEVLFDVHDLRTRIAKTAKEAIAEVESGAIGVVVQDMNFKAGATSGREGITLFREIRRIAPKMPVVLMTAWTSLETAVELVREGASDYIAKPWSDQKLLATVKALLSAGAEAVATSIVPGAELCGTMVRDPKMLEVVALAIQVAPAEVPVLITGPNGSGKEKIAEIVHANSARRAGPFVKVNLGALPDELFEAELFGAEAGAYTGSQKLRIGRFEAAHGGTLFLDEIGNLSLAGQKKLLRVLESQEYERLGSSETRRADVRLLAATNSDLRREIDAGRFREDLLFRLNVIELAVPALRDRPEDILVLARGFLALRPGAVLSAETERVLLKHDWPGNVRELLNRIRRAAVVAKREEIEPADLDLPASGAPAAAAALDSEEVSEKSAIEAALRRCEGSVSRAATELGVSRQALYRRMDRLGIVLERRPRDG